MRLNKRATIVSTASLMIIGGAAYGYTGLATPASGTGTGNIANGTISIDYVTTIGTISLGTPAQVTMLLTATGQAVRVKHVKVEAASAPPWDTTRCGDRVSDFVGADADLPQPVDIAPGDSNAVTLDDSNAANIKVTLKNDPHVNQSRCVLRLKVTVS
jgi:hypothetical protein